MKRRPEGRARPPTNWWMLSMARLYLSQSLCMLSKLKKAIGRHWLLPSSEQDTRRGWHVDRCHRVRQRLAPTQRSRGTEKYPTWVTRLGQEF